MNQQASLETETPTILSIVSSLSHIVAGAIARFDIGYCMIQSEQIRLFLSDVKQ